MKKALIASFATSALVIGAFAMSASAYVFSSNLSVGSQGPDVVALQSFLVSKGLLTMPAGVLEGYFGSLTKTAVVAYQASVSVPSTGYVGPLTRAQLNAGGSVTTTTTTTTGTGSYGLTVCPPTWSCPSLSGTTVTTTTGSTATGITTLGVQGILSVTQGPVSDSVANAGQTKVPVLDIRLQAQYSDLSVQSVQLDLGPSTNIYNFLYSNLYLVDPTTGNVLSTIALNPSTVVQNGNNYVVSVTGFNFIVPKGTYKDLVVEADLYNQINTPYTSACTTGCTTEGTVSLAGSSQTLGNGQWVLGVDGNGIRAVDGAGVSQYGPSGNVDAIYQIMTVGSSLITSATANLSLDASSPLNGSVGVTNTTQGTYLGLPVMIFDVNANGDTLHLHQVVASITNTGSGTVNAAYLYNGSTPVASASVSSNGTAVFQNITDGTAGASIANNSFTAFTIKVDVAGLVSGINPANITASIVNATTSGSTVYDTYIYNSMDSNIINNSPVAVLLAQGNPQAVFGEGPVFTLSGSPTMTKTLIASNNTTGSTTFQYLATFNVNVQAVGENVTFGLPGATIASFGSSTTAVGIANAWINGSSTTVGGPTIIGSFSAPNNTTVSGNSFTLSQNQSVTVPVTYSFTVNNPGASLYAIQLNGINWSDPNGVNHSTGFMNGQSAWRTSAI